MITYRCSYKIFDRWGTLTIRTGANPSEVDDIVTRQIIKHLSMAGLACNSSDITDLKCVSKGGADDVANDTQSDTKGSSEGVYKLVAFGVKGGQGPYHMLSNGDEDTGCVCGTNRNPKTIVSRITIKKGEKWPKNKHCPACRKVWKAKERDRKNN